MASPTLRTLESESSDSTQPPESPSLRVLDLQAVNEGAQPPATPVLRVLDLQAVNEGAQPQATPVLRVLDITAGYGPPPPDYMPPGDPSFGTIEASQVNGNPARRTQVTLHFSTVTTSQVAPGEYLGEATGSEQILVTRYSPLASGSVEVYQVTGYTSGGGSTVLASTFSRGAFRISVGSVTGFSVGEWVEIYEAGVAREYAKILSIDGSVLTLDHPLLTGGYTLSATVKEVDVTLMTETSDWSANLTTGQITLVSGQFTAGNQVFSRYQQDISDLDHYEAYRIPGAPYGDQAHYDEVTGHGSVVTVDAAVTSGATQVQEILSVAQGGQTFSYYLFALDAEGNVSRAQSVEVETIPSVITDLTKNTGPNEVTLSWTVPSEANVNGVNIYRSSGSWDPATAVKVNSVPVTSGSFLDGANNVINRRPSGDVPYPASGQTYYYTVEVEDTASDWDTGTQNQSADPLKAAITTALKTDD